jgi:hypothetical protein
MTNVLIELTPIQKWFFFDSNIENNYVKYQFYLTLKMNLNLKKLLNIMIDYNEIKQKNDEIENFNNLKK